MHYQGAVGHRPVVRDDQGPEVRARMGEESVFVGTNRIRVQKGTGHELEERFAKRGGVEREAGFVRFQMWKLDADDEYEEYLIVTHWESKEHQRAWVRGEGFREAHSGPRAEFILGHARFRGYNVQLASEPQEAKSVG